MQMNVFLAISLTSIACAIAAPARSTDDGIVQCYVTFDSTVEKADNKVIDVSNILQVILEFPSGIGPTWQLDPTPSFVMLGERHSQRADRPGNLKTETYWLKPTKPGNFVLSWRLVKPRAYGGTQTDLREFYHSFTLSVRVVGG